MTIHRLTAKDVEVSQGALQRRSSPEGSERYRLAPEQETHKLQVFLSQTQTGSHRPLSPTCRELFSQLDPSLHDIAFPQVAALRQEKANTPALGTDSSHLLHRRIAKLQAALAIGLRPQSSEEGKTQPLIGRDIRGKELGVLKPTALGAAAEVAAYQVDVYFRIGLTPPTCWIKWAEQRYSFMTWISRKEEYIHAEEIVKHAASSHTLTEVELFQRMAIFDVFIGNLDRHYGNWFIQEDLEHHLTNIKTIDHGNTFPALQGCSKQMYLWRAEPLAGYAFTQKSRELLARFTPENVAEVIRRIQKVCPNFLTPPKSEALAKRAFILQHCATQPKRCPLHLLPRCLLADPRISPGAEQLTDAEVTSQTAAWTQSLESQARAGTLYDSLVTDDDVRQWIQERQ